MTQMFDGLWAIAAFVVAIGVLVAFHEFGHFWVARRLGVKVLRFSIGFGKPLWMRRGRDGVEYVVAAVPLGGYVKMLDEREGPVDPADLGRAFNRQTVGRRSLIVAAGPAFNFMLAIVAYWLVYMGGVSGIRPLVAEPAPGTRAAVAGLHAGDLVTSVNGSAVATWQDLHTRLIEHSLGADRLDLSVSDAESVERAVELSLYGVRLDPEFLFIDLGLKPFDPPLQPVLDEVVPGDPGDVAGLRVGDLLLTYDGKPIESWQQWATWLRANPGRVVRVGVQRDGAVVESEMIIARDAKTGLGRFGGRVRVPEDFAKNLRTEIKRNPWDAFTAANAQTWQMSVLTLKMLAHMVTGDISVKNVSGPIQIAEYAGVSARLGLTSFLSFMAIISISLGVLNLLPIPVLDGGHLLYYMAEALKGSPLTERMQALGQQMGMGLLLALMGLAFYNDFHRLIG
ncbi:MAG: RIP metalloprotease RseP [Pseudomonadota bacterium]